MLFAPDANAVLLGCASGFEALDPKSGIPRTVGFTVLNSVGVTDFFALQNGRVGTLSPKAAEIKVWDGKSGRLLEKHPLPDPGPGTGRATTLSAFLAPDEKHLVVARSGAAAPDHPSVPFKVFDATGKREELALSWKGGSVLFATGSSRMLVAEWSGRCRWFDLSSGAAAESWDLGPDGAAHKITSASADGSVVGYTGPAATKGNGSAVLDGKTGKPIRVFHQEYHPNAPVEVSADGKRAALVYRADRDAVSIDVVDLATGARLGRAKLARASTGASASTQVPLFALAPDGRALAVYDPVSSRTHLFELPK